MKKQLLMAFVTILSMALISSSAQAIVYLNDTFDRANLAPWACYTSCGGSCSIVSNEAQLVTPGNCSAFFGHVWDVQIDNFTMSLDYTHATDAILGIQWINDSSETVAIYFDTGNNLIEFNQLGPITRDINGWDTYSFCTIRGDCDYYTFPYVFGFANGNTYHIDITKEGPNIEIRIENNTVFDLTLVEWFSTQWGNAGVGVYHRTSTKTITVDNIVVQTDAFKIVPDVSVIFSPSSQVPPETEVTAYCDVIDVPIPVTTLEYPIGTVVSQPFTSTFDAAGDYWFLCTAPATDTSIEQSQYGQLEVSLLYATSTTTTTIDPTLFDPISPINQTQWEEEGYGTVALLFSPFFLGSIFMIVMAAVAGKFGGPIASFGAMVILLIVYTVYGIYPAWIGIAIGLLTGAVVAKLVGVIG